MISLKSTRLFRAAISTFSYSLLKGSLSFSTEVIAVLAQVYLRSCGWLLPGTFKSGTSTRPGLVVFKS